MPAVSTAQMAGADVGTLRFAHPTIPGRCAAAECTAPPENWRGADGFPPGPPSTNQPACKPGSVGYEARAPHVTAIPLERRLPGASSNLPGRHDLDTDRERAALRRCVPRRPYSVLLPVGFAVPPTLPPTRCALTAPFHPCRAQRRTRRAAAVCFLWHCPWGRPRRMLSGTACPWSPDFPPRRPFGRCRSGRPAD
jgi:hypothetical protein